MTWKAVCSVDDIPVLGARRVTREASVIPIAVFRNAEDKVFALLDRCPHKGGPLSQGIVHGERVTCPLHEWVIDLRSGHAVGADTGCTPAFAARVTEGRVEIDIPPAIVGEAAFDPRAHALFERA